MFLPNYDQNSCKSFYFWVNNGSTSHCSYILQSFLFILVAFTSLPALAETLVFKFGKMAKCHKTFCTLGWGWPMRKLFFQIIWALTGALLIKPCLCTLFSCHGLMAPSWRIGVIVCVSWSAQLNSCIIVVDGNTHSFSSPFSFFFLCYIWIETCLLWRANVV